MSLYSELKRRNVLRVAVAYLAAAWLLTEVAGTQTWLHLKPIAPAYAALADSWVLLSLHGNISPLTASQKAQPLIDKALTIDPALAEAFAALGLARWQTGQIDAAESALRQAAPSDENGPRTGRFYSSQVKRTSAS